MRGLLIAVAIAVLLLIIAIGTGFINLRGDGGSLPKVEVEGGNLPTVDADVGDVDVGTKKETIEVPTIDIDNARTDAKEDKDK